MLTADHLEQKRHAYAFTKEQKRHACTILALTLWLVFIQSTYGIYTKFRGMYIATVIFN